MHNIKDITELDPWNAPMTRKEAQSLLAGIE